MSSSDAGPLLRLRIEPATPLTEVSITDARFGKIALPSNAGTIELDLPCGAYEVAFRDGAHVQESLVVLTNETAPTVVRQKDPAPTIESIAPLSDSEIDFASETVSAQDGQQIALVVRDPRGSELEAEGIARPDPGSRLTGLSLLDETGNVIALDKMEIGERSSYLSYSPPPGGYRLRLATGLDDLVLETSVFACPGWRTRVYARTRSYKEGDFRADLARMQVRMSPIDASRRRSSEERALETNALALLTGRRTLEGVAFRELLQDLLARKAINPMFALFAGHLLPGRDPGDVDLLAELVLHLEALITTGPDRTLPPPTDFRHPDVEALKLRLALLRKTPSVEVLPFPSPPMLAASWQNILRVAERSADLIPLGSLSDRVSSRMVSAGASLVWSAPPENLAPPVLHESSLGGPTTRSMMNLVAGGDAEGGPPGGLAGGAGDADDAPPFDQAAQLISQALRRKELREWFRARCMPRDSDDESAAARGSEYRPLRTFSVEELAVAQAIHPIAPHERFQRSFDRAEFGSTASASGVSAEALAARLLLPTTTVTRAVEGLCAKLRRQAAVLNIDLKAGVQMSRPELIIPYDPRFLGDGFVAPMPALTDPLRANAYADGTVLDYTHFSLVMHRQRKVAVFTAHNVDASRTVRVKGGLTWRMDERAGDCQLGPETYVANQLDKGHLVRREDVLWGSVPEAKLANRATFFYTNAAPQHRNFNQDEWVKLEDWVLDHATEFSYRLCVFTGPVLRSNDPVLTDLPSNLRTAFPVAGPAQIPAAFWKVIVLRDATAGGEDLSVVCFAMRQSEMWNDREGRRLLSLKVHQVSLEAIEGWTGLDFGSLRSADELAWSEERSRARSAGEEPEWPLVRAADDIVRDGTSRRLRGLRAGKDAGNAGPEATRSVPSNRLAPSRGAGLIHDCGCGEPGEAFDAREALAVLSRDLARLTEVVAAQARTSASAAEAAEPQAAPRSRSRKRGQAAAPEAGGMETRAISAAEADAPDERVARLVDAAPDDMKDMVREFALTVTRQDDVAKGLIPVPRPSELERIVGGGTVPPGGVPSCVCIGSATQWFCTGVLVAPKVVLTAAHCGSSITRILIGNQAVPYQSGRVVAVRQVILHPKYVGPPFHENDIIVLILDTNAGVPPALVASPAQLVSAKEVQLVGFGFDDKQATRGFGTKREVRAPMGALRRNAGDDLAQLEAVTGFHSDYEFVAGRKALGKDTCNGDSGGPAYIDTPASPVLAGLTSRSMRGADVRCGAGGIYVRVDRFKPWINEVLASAGQAPLP